MNDFEEKTSDLIERMRKEHEDNIKSGVAVFDGSRSWKEFIRAIAREAGGLDRKLEDDFEELPPVPSWHLLQP